MLLTLYSPERYYGQVRSFSLPPLLAFPYPLRSLRLNALSYKRIELKALYKFFSTLGNYPIKQVYAALKSDDVSLGIWNKDGCTSGLAFLLGVSKGVGYAVGCDFILLSVLSVSPNTPFVYK